MLRYPLKLSGAPMPPLLARTGFGGIAWLRRLANSSLATLVIVAFAFLTRSPSLLLSSMEWDEGVYIVMAQQWLRGNMPYVAVWDQHPPALPALLALGQAVIPDPVLGARLIAMAAVAITAVIIHRFCARHARRPGLGLVAALLYIVCMSRFGGLLANTEVFNNAIVASAVFLLFGAARRSDGGLTRAACAALLLGIGLQIKYVILPEAILLCLGYLATRHARDRDLRALAAPAALLIAAGCLPTILVAGYFWHKGILGPFLDANIASNLIYVGIVPSLSSIVGSGVSGLAPLLGPVLLVSYAVARRFRAPARPVAAPVERWVLLWAAAAALDICLPMKFYVHYFFALYPPLCIAGVLALDRVAAGRRAVFMSGCVLLCLVAAPLWIAGVARTVRCSTVDASRVIADIVRDAGAGDTDLFVYNHDPVIYALAGVRPPTPYMLKAEFGDFSSSAHLDSVAEINRIMDTLPRFVVIVPELLTGASSDALDHLVMRRLAAYHVVQEISERNGREVRLYERGR